MIDATNNLIGGPFPEGWKAELSKGDERYTLTIEFSPGHSSLLPISKEVWQSGDLGLKSKGESSRNLNLWSAIARFLNAGGSIDDVYDGVAMCRDLPDIALTGFVLLDSWQEVPETTHVFIATDNRKAIVWDEGMIVEAQSMDELALYYKSLIADVEQSGG